MNAEIDIVGTKLGRLSIIREVERGNYGNHRFLCKCECGNFRVIDKSNLITTLYSGIDRVDNNKGYLVENCVPCCKHCNSMKLNRGMEEFKEHVIRLYNNLI